MSSRYDLVVIGGGINGAGVAQAAAAAGYSVLVLEREALACGTSSRSSKLIHGGLRYLETLELGLVREALQERRLLLRLAPDIVRLSPFYLPLYADSFRRPGYVRAGLMLYALLGGDEGARFENVPLAQWGTLDGLRTDGLKTVFRYYDAQTDDAALTRAVMRSAMSLGAELACPAQFLGADRTEDGYRVHYNSPRPQTCHARALVDAAGPWVETVWSLIGPPLPDLSVELVQGSHIVINGNIAGGCYYLEAEDRRGVFVLPWQGHSLVGTTEVAFTGEPAHAKPDQREIAYLRTTFARHFPRRSDTVLASFTGVRVLPKSDGAAFTRSREVKLTTDTRHKPRLVSICGGKLTAYRRTAAKVMRRLHPALGERSPRADTARLPLTPD